MRGVKVKLINIPLEKNKKTGEVTYSKERFFFCTVENLEENTTLSRKVQTKAIEKLEKLGLVVKINKKLDGQGSQTRYFTINTDVELILSMLSDKSKNRPETIDNTGKVQKGLFDTSQKDFSKCPKGTINNTNINNISLINEEKRDDDPHVNILLLEEKATIQLTEPQKKKVTTWDTEKIKQALELFINHGGLKFTYLEKCYKNPIDVPALTKNSIQAKSVSKNPHFTNTYSHNWDLEELEKREREYMEKTCTDEQTK